MGGSAVFGRLPVHHWGVASQIAWLDASPEEQRRVREVVQLFSQSETVDELGGRKIVITLADALFPGTSVLHSRARYLLFVPWFCQAAVGKKNPRSTLDYYERRLIARFIEDDELEGLVGRDAGPRVKQLPSTMYWTALDAWGVLRWPGTIDQTLHRAAAARRSAPEDADELAGRSIAIWDAGVGTLPPGFPEEHIDGGFRLKHAEACWLRDRLLLHTDGSLLAHLIRTETPLADASRAPWLDPACQSAPPDILGVLDDAERFALATDGARLLYSLLVAEKYLDAGYTRVDIDLETYRQMLDAWAQEVDDSSTLFEGWNRADFWTFVRDANVRVDEFSRRFFDTWLDVTQRGDVDGIADRSELRRLVAARELFLKKGQARLENPKLLGAWTGGTAARVTFRWSQVHRLVTDILDGLGRDDAVS